MVPMETGMTRREMVAGMVAVAGLAMLPRSASASHAQMSVPHFGLSAPMDRTVALDLAKQMRKRAGCLSIRLMEGRDGVRIWEEWQSAEAQASFRDNQPLQSMGQDYQKIAL